MTTHADLDPALWRRFQEHRARGIPPHYFKPHPPPVPFTFVEETLDGRTVPTARWCADAYQVVVRVHADDAPSDPLDALGTFVDHGAFPETFQRRRRAAGEFHRFQPAYGVRKRCADHHAAGWAKGPAYAQAVRDALADHARAESYGDAWWMTGVVVEVFHLGDDPENSRPLGGASIWGVESDCGEEYWVELAEELSQEALDEVRRDLARACPSCGQPRPTAPPLDPHRVRRS